MSSIVTLTFNPALDKSTSVPELIPDKKLKCAQPISEPGGGGINVARALKKLGGEATAVYLAGGVTGETITRLLANECVTTKVTTIKACTRENLVIADIANKKQYLFNMPGPLVKKREWEQCLNAIVQIPDAGYIVVSGSLPVGVPPAVFGMITNIARKKNAKLIVDTSGEGLKAAVQAGVYLIKPNIGELALLTGREKPDLGSIGDMAREVIGQGKCEIVVVSMGQLGALLVTKDCELSIVPPKLKVKSTVGAGDSMLAGIVYSLSQNSTLNDAVKYGVACGSAATLRAGTELCRKKDADHLYSKLLLGNAGH